MTSLSGFGLLASAVVAFVNIGLNYADLFDVIGQPPEDATLDFNGLAAKYVRPATQYEVVTEDGYILTVFRIPGSRGYPVLLMHGLLDSADTWLLRGERSLGAALAGAGYDVWFGNSRGSRYARRHARLDPERDAAYWDWSFHELGHYDLPAIIDAVLNETRAASLSAVGHSRGNQIFYILGSTRPEYNAKVNLMIALAPICYLHHVRPPLATVIDSFPAADRTFGAFHIEVTEVLGYNCTSTRTLRALCTHPPFGPEVCLNGIVFPLSGFDPAELEPSFVNVFASHFPAGTSWKDLLHFAQVRDRREFAQFDYGTDANLLAYGSPAPPAYELGRVSMPAALLAGRNDHFAPLADVALLRERLPNVVDYTVLRRPAMNHPDFTWGRRMHLYLFPDIFRILKRYND